MLVLRVPYGTGDYADGDLFVLHRRDILLFSVLGNRPHDDVRHVADREDPLVGVEDRHIASAAGCRPVDGKVDLAAGGCSGEECAEVRRRHEVGAIALRCRCGCCCCLRCFRRCGRLCCGRCLRCGCRCLGLIFFLLLSESVKERHHCPSFARGLGPRVLIVLTNSVMVFWNFSPSEAETHSSLSLLGSKPYCSRTSLKSAILLLVL